MPVAMQEQSAQQQLVSVSRRKRKRRLPMNNKHAPNDSKNRSDALPESPPPPPQHIQRQQQRQNPRSLPDPTQLFEGEISSLIASMDPILKTHLTKTLKEFPSAAKFFYLS